MPRARRKIPGSDELRRAQARAARDALAESRAAYLSARDSYAAIRREWPERVRGALAALAAQYRAAAEQIRQKADERRRSWLETWQAKRAETLAALKTKFQAERDRIRSQYRGRRGEARELARAAQAARQQRSEALRALRTDAQRRAGSKLSERMEEARSVAESTIEARTLETYDGRASVSGRELLPAFRSWAASSVGREAYQASVRKLRAKFPRGGWRWGDAGDGWAVAFLEWAAEHAETLIAELGAKGDRTGRCLDRVTAEVVALGLDPEASDQEWERRSAECL